MIQSLLSWLGWTPQQQAQSLSHEALEKLKPVLVAGTLLGVLVIVSRARKPQRSDTWLKT